MLSRNQSEYIVSRDLQCDKRSVLTPAPTE